MSQIGILILILLTVTLIVLCYIYYNNLPSPFPIDIVYTWAGENSSFNKRTSYNNELKYSLRSVLKYAPWVNRIFILMNPPKQIPSWFNFNSEYSKKITVLDQTSTFPQRYNLPCTNSNSIETTLQNIPGLSEHFVYFNDDVFLGQPVKYTEFFTRDGKAIVSDTVLKTVHMVQQNKKDILKIKYPPTVKRFYPHIPIPLIKSQIVKYHKDYPEYIEWVRTQRARTGIGCKICKDFNMICPCAQQHHIVTKYMYDNDKAVVKNFNLHKSTSCRNGSYINSKCIHMLDNIYKNPPKFFCINDTTDDPSQKEYVRNKMNEFFEKFYKADVPFYEKIDISKQ